MNQRTKHIVGWILGIAYYVACVTGCQQLPSANRVCVEEQSEPIKTAEQIACNKLNECNLLASNEMDYCLSCVRLLGSAFVRNGFDPKQYVSQTDTVSCDQIKDIAKMYHVFKCIHDIHVVDSTYYPAN